MTHSTSLAPGSYPTIPVRGVGQWEQNRKKVHFIGSRWYVRLCSKLQSTKHDSYPIPYVSFHCNVDDSNRDDVCDDRTLPKEERRSLVVVHKWHFGRRTPCRARTYLSIGCMHCFLRTIYATLLLRHSESNVCYYHSKYYAQLWNGIDMWKVANIARCM